MKNEKWFGCIGIIAAGVALSIVSVILNAWALKVLWGWFFVPFGLPSLAIVEAAGISLVVSFLIKGAVNVDDDINWYKVVASAILSPLFAVAMGWVLLRFM